MNIIQSKLEEVLKAAFASCGYDESLGAVVPSNRPDLCEYQCNGAMAGAKKYHKAPFLIADEVAASCTGNPLFENIESVKPGFINITVAPAALAEMPTAVAADEHLLTEQAGTGKKVIMDYGGPNVAKPPARRTSARSDHRGKLKAHLPLCRLRSPGRYPSGRLGPADGPDHGGSKTPPAGSSLL